MDRRGDHRPRPHHSADPRNRHGLHRQHRHPGLRRLPRDRQTRHPRHQPHHTLAWEHHTANGLIAEVRAASTRQNGPAAVGNAAEEYLESLEQRFQLVPTGTNVDFDLGFLGLLAIDTSPLSYRKLYLTTIRRLITILGGPDPYATHHEGRHRVEDCITRDIHDYRHYLETIQLKDCGK